MHLVDALNPRYHGLAERRIELFASGEVGGALSFNLLGAIVARRSQRLPDLLLDARELRALIVDLKLAPRILTPHSDQRQPH
jgi:hypothetical protein